MITSKIIANGILRALLTVVVVSILLYFLYQIQSVIIYLFIALVFTLIGSPILKFLKTKLKINHTVATILTLAFFIIIFAGLILLFIPLVLSQGQNLALLDINQITANTGTIFTHLSAFLEDYGIDANQIFSSSNLSSVINFDFIPRILNSILGGIGSFGMGLASVLFITFFFLKDKKLFTESFKKLIPDSHEDKILNSLEKINELLSRYFIGLILQLTIVFILYVIVLLIFGLEDAVIIAFICAILNIIPYIGPLIASVMAAILTMMSHIGGAQQDEMISTTIYVLIGFWIVQVIDNNLSQPIIFSKSVNSHPLEIFLVILIAGFTSGILGMIIAVPVYTIIKVILKEFFPENTIVKMLTKNI